jgi:pilus assembly protein CpaF
MLSILITDKDGSHRRQELQTEEAIIGRADEADIILPKNSVSKRHARIVRKNDRYVIADLGSTNGTYVNGRKIHGSLVLAEGDKIYLGDFILTVEKTLAGGERSTAGLDRASSARLYSMPPREGGPARDIGEALRAVVSRIDATHGADGWDGPGAMQRARDAVERAVAELSGAGAIEETIDLAGLKELAARELAGLGALEGLVGDRRVRAIKVNGPTFVEVDFGHGFEPVNAAFSDAARLERVLGRLLRRAGWDLDVRLPQVVETMLPDGTRLVALLPPLAPRGPYIMLERPAPAPTREAIVESGMIDAEGFRILETLGKRGHSVALIGPEGSGADVLAKALAAFADGEGGLVFAERVPSLTQLRDDAVGLVAGALGEPSFRTVVEQAARLAPHRLFVDGVRGGELREVLEILAGRRKGDVVGVRAVHEGRVGPPLKALAGLDGGASASLDLLVIRAVRAAALCVATPEGPRVAAIRELRPGDEGIAEKVLWSP